MSAITSPSFERSTSTQQIIVGAAAAGTNARDAICLKIWRYWKSIDKNELFTEEMVQRSFSRTNKASIQKAPSTSYESALAS